MNILKNSETAAAETAAVGRSSYWDNIKGLLIVLTVFAHFLYQSTSAQPISQIVNAIYTFHMPAFVFVSGYFGKSKRSQSFEGIIKLVFLFFIFNGIMGLIYGVTPIIEPKYSYWYLAAMIVWRLTARHIRKFKEIELILLTVSIFAGFYDSIDNSFAIARIISFYPYYMAGYLLTEEKSAELTRQKSSKRAAVGAACLAAGAALIFISSVFFKFTENDLLMCSYNAPLAAFGRCVLFIIGFVMIYALRNLSPDKKIPLLTMFGKNSLWIFLFHRPVTLETTNFLHLLPASAQIAVSAGLTVALCAVLSCEPFAGLMNKFADAGVEIFIPKEKKSRGKLAAQAFSLIVALGYVFVLITDTYQLYFAAHDEELETPAVVQQTDMICDPISPEQAAAFSNAFRLTFAGDLILLEDQVKRGYNGSGYDFSDVFQYTKKHISSADYAVGVFEGPMAGEAAGYTTSNYDDGKEVRLNFPDEFAQNVKDAGFDLVTTANNHLLDKGEAGAKRTLDVLDEIGLDHTGSYRSAEEKESARVKSVETGGIKFAVLSYTYGSNFCETDELVNGDTAYLTSFIKDTEGELFEKLKKQVKRDFEEAKAQNPDLIVVLPHIGTQFSNTYDAEQDVWFNIFKECGADIILGDHPHVVEPVKIEDYNGKNVFTLYCPGNFANIYREHQGDTSALVDIYIDRETKRIIGGGIVPLYTQSPMDGNFRALPIYEIENNAELRAQLSTDDYERAKNANAIVTEVMLGGKQDITSIAESCLFNAQGYLRPKASGLKLTDKMKSSILYKSLQNASEICFIGDSVTEGTKNGGCPWYEPIEEYLPDKKISNFSKGGCTIGYMLDNIGEIPTADLYVIAIGTNDVRYRDDSVCAMTAEEFVNRAAELKDRLSEKNSSARFVFIAPWYSTDGDSVSVLEFHEKTQLNEEYSSALEKYCADSSIEFINANPRISAELLKVPDRTYLLDHIHPNASRGVVMYSEAVLSVGADG